MNEKGQTSVEYILMIVILVSVASVVLPRIGEYIYDNDNSIIKNTLRQWDAAMGQEIGYKRFRLRR